jgi:diacylglycerol kinase (ATP)
MTNPVAESSSISSFAPAMVFINPTAGAGRARSYIPRIRKVFEAADIDVEFLCVEKTKDLESAAHAAIESGKRLLIAFGGDGTMQALVNSALDADVVLGVLPAGGGNDFAAGLELPMDPIAAAEAILRGQTRRVDLARARTADGRVRFYLGGGGIGIDADSIRHANGAFRRLPGRARYVASALRSLWSFRGVGVKVEFPLNDVAPFEAKCLLAAVLNAPTYGAGIKLAPEARIDDGWLDVVIVGDLSMFKIAGLLPRLLRNGELRTSHIKRFQVRSVRLTTDRPCMFHGDGEILGAAPVEIEAVPKAVRVLAPARK